MQTNISRSHAATLSSLDSLKIEHFTYQGWRDDYYAIIQTQIQGNYVGEELTSEQNSTMTRDRFLGMINKQRLVNGDRSHSQIALLDSVRTLLTYPGWKSDVEHAERIHIRFPSLFDDQISFLMMKQRIFQYDDGHRDRNVSVMTSCKRSKQNYPLLSATHTDPDESNSSCRKESSCVICLHSKREYAFVPCGHLCVCWDCSISVANLDGRCPLCRVNATHVMRIFK